MWALVLLLVGAATAVPCRKLEYVYSDKTCATPVAVTYSVFDLPVSSCPFVCKASPCGAYVGADQNPAGPWGMSVQVRDPLLFFRLPPQGPFPLVSRRCGLDQVAQWHRHDRHDVQRRPVQRARVRVRRGDRQVHPDCVARSAVCDSVVQVLVVHHGASLHRS